MKKRKLIGILIGASSLILTACANQQLKAVQEPNASTTSAPSKIVQSTSSTRTQKQPAQNQERVVRQFLTAYTTYTSLNTQKENISPYLTEELKQQLAVNVKAAPSVDEVSSVGHDISIWKNEQGQYLGLVKIEVNAQTTNTQVFVMHLTEKDGKTLISSFSCPTQN